MPELWRNGQLTEYSLLLSSQVKAERDVIESELKSATIDMKDTFLKALGQDGAINEPAVSVETLGQTFGPLQRQVKESIEKQESLIERIKVEWRRLIFGFN